MYSKKVRTYIVISLVIGWASSLFYLSFRSKILKYSSAIDYKIKETTNPKNKIFTEKRILLGTYVEIISTDKRAFKIAFDEIDRIDRLLSKYNPESEIFKLNRSGLIKASPETFFIINKSIELSKATNGAFDITVEPLMQLWGFTNKNYRIPNKREIKNTLKLIGSDKIILNKENNTIKFKLPKMRIDLGAIAKGYALDCAVRKLKGAGIKSCLINAGGQIYCLGDFLSEPWRVGIRGKNKKIITTLKLRNKAISTSGDYEQFFIKESVSYGHILNPKTGYPAKTGISSVSVIADYGLTADALSTAIFVLGIDEGKKVASQFKNTRIVISKTDHVQNN